MNSLRLPAWLTGQGPQRAGGADHHRHDAGDDGAAAAGVCARRLLQLQHRAVDHRAADRLYTVKPLDFMVFPTVLLVSTMLRLSLNVASTRVVLTEGHTGPRRRRQGDRSLRPLPDRRQLHGRYRGVRHPDHHQLHRGHQGCRPHRRSRRALRAGCDAGQADGDRRRPQRRPDRRAGSAPPPPGSRRRKPSSTAPWTVPANTCAATPSPASWSPSSTSSAA